MSALIIVGKTEINERLRKSSPYLDLLASTARYTVEGEPGNDRGYQLVGVKMKRGHPQVFLETADGSEGWGE
jgi:hypothetical protein